MSPAALENRIETPARPAEIVRVYGPPIASAWRTCGDRRLDHVPCHGLHGPSSSGKAWRAAWTAALAVTGAGLLALG